MGRSSGRRRAKAQRCSTGPASPAPRHRRPLPRPRDGESRARASVPPNRRARALPRAELRGRPRPRGLSAHPLRAADHTCAPARRGERRARSRPWDEGPRSPNRTVVEQDVPSTRAGARRALPHARATDPARGAKRARVRPAERASPCATVRERFRTRPRVVRAMVRWMAAPLRGRRPRARRRTGRAGTNMASDHRLAAAWVDRPGRGPGTPRPATPEASKTRRGTVTEHRAARARRVQRPVRARRVAPTHPRGRLRALAVDEVGRAAGYATQPTSHRRARCTATSATRPPSESAIPSRSDSGR